VSIGETLTAARQDAGLSVAQVAERTRIRGAVIRDIESGDFTSCGGNFYARGHIRSISKVIGIDAEPLIQEFDAAHGGAPQPVSAADAFEPEIPVRIRERRSPNWSAAMAMALAAVVIYGVFQVLAGGPDPQTARQVAQQPGRERPTATASPTGPAGPATQAPSDAIAQAPRKNVQLKVTAERSSWLNVQDERGRQLYSGLLGAGDVKEWTAKKQIRVVIGNGGGVRLTVNGQDLGSPGIDGQVLRLSFTPDDPDAG
jgi:cytoskeletal protein RodZ